jgi:cytochrome c55X
MTRSTWLVLSLVLSAPLVAEDGISSDRAQQLENLLVQDCGSCHGLQMKGGLGPALLPEVLRGKSPEYLSTVILQGRKGTAMPPWSALLSPAEALWIAEQLLKGNPE